MFCVMSTRVPKSKLAWKLAPLVSALRAFCGWGDPVDRGVATCDAHSIWLKSFWRCSYVANTFAYWRPPAWGRGDSRTTFVIQSIFLLFDESSFLFRPIKLSQCFCSLVCFFAIGAFAASNPFPYCLAIGSSATWSACASSPAVKARFLTAGSPTVVAVWTCLTVNLNSMFLFSSVMDWVTRINLVIVYSQAVSALHSCSRDASSRRTADAALSGCSPFTLC